MDKVVFNASTEGFNAPRAGEDFVMSIGGEDTIRKLVKLFREHESVRITIESSKRATSQEKWKAFDEEILRPNMRRRRGFFESIGKRLDD